jgi:hypothetical protein
MIDARTNEDGIVELVIEQFLERQRRGENPTISEYCVKYPRFSAEIRSLLGTIEFAEDPVCMLLLFLANRKKEHGD